MATPQQLQSTKEQQIPPGSNLHRLLEMVASELAKEASDSRARETATDHHKKR